MEITFTIGEGINHHARVPLNITIKDLKEQIAKDLHVASESLTLSCKGCEFTDDSTKIYFYGVNPKYDIIDVSISKV